MNIEEQLEYTDDIINNRKEQILNKLKANADNIKSWGSQELRQYIADYYRFELVGNFKMPSIQKRYYKNTIATTNL